jgi:hypothetical protein
MSEQPEPLPGPSMRRTPPGPPPVAVAFAEPEEPEESRQSWFEWLKARLAAILQN